MNIGIYIYENAEVLDFSGPFEVFSTASRISDDPWLLKPLLIAETIGTITARAGYQVIASHGFADTPPLDILLIAGGIHNKELKKTSVIQWIQEHAAKASYTTSVCTGVFLLAEAGVVTNQQVTTHHEDIAELQSTYPALQVNSTKRWVKDGDIITSAGISAGIDMALYLVEILHSRELAEKTAEKMEYQWSD